MDVKVNISTVQYNDNEKLDTIKLSALGNLYSKNNDTYIVYKEKQDDNEVTTTIKISEKEIMIKKFGNINSTMVFEESKINITKYKTPQGMFIIETNTNKLDINFNKDGNIDLKIDYNIKIMDLFEGRNQINIQVQK